jgi:hypothetical protein
MVWKLEKDNHKLRTFAMHALAVMFAAHTNTGTKNKNINNINQIIYFL